MKWNIDIAKVTVRQGESIAIDLRAFDDNTQPVDISASVVRLILLIGTKQIESCSTEPAAGEIKLMRSTEVNRVYVNIPSARTKKYVAGNVSAQIEVNLSGEISKKTYQIFKVVESKMTKLL